jgi:Cu/Ag efflux protein CusF
MSAYAGLGTPFLSITLVSVEGIRADRAFCRMPARRVSMTARLYRPFVIGLLPIALMACTNSAPTVVGQGAAPPLGVDLGGSGPVAPPRAGEARPSQAQHGSDMQMAHDDHSHVRGLAIVNAVDPVAHKVKLTHSPIPDIGWPAMTMEFLVAPSVDLSAVRPNRRVNFIMEQGQGGMYEIQAITPAEGGL